MWWASTQPWLDLLLLTVDGSPAAACPRRIAHGGAVPLRSKRLPADGGLTVFLRLLADTELPVRELAIDLELRDGSRNHTWTLCRNRVVEPKESLTLESRIELMY